MTPASLQLGRVVASYPADHSVDVVGWHDNRRYPAVQVLAPHASANSGGSDLPDPGLPGGDARWTVRPGQGREIIAVMAFASGGPLVIGFLFPQQNAVLAGEANRTVYRHPSGAWWTIGPNGDMHARHPSGAEFRMGEAWNPGAAGATADGQWQDPVGRPPVRMEMSGNGARLTILPSGKVEVLAPAEVAFTVPKATFSGDVEVAGDVKAGTVSLRNHKHGGVQAGAAQTQPPVT